MTDYFALLNEPRRPWLNEDELKTKFLARSAELHPDRFHHASETERLAANQRYLDLNSAYNCLREPKNRLACLLELELRAKPKLVQTIPAGFMELFIAVSELCRAADSFLRDKAGICSPLIRVKMFEQGFERMEKLKALQQILNTKRNTLTAELFALNAIWASAPPLGSPGHSDALPLERLEEIYRELSYLARWSEQIQERLVQLSF